MQVSDVTLQESTVCEHLHRLFDESQNDPVDSPTQVEIVPHVQDPELQDSPSLLHSSLVPHLQTPLVQVSDIPLHASTVSEHLHTLFVFQAKVVVMPHNGK